MEASRTATRRSSSRRLARAEAPQHLGVIGLGMAGPTIIALRHRGPEGALPAAHPLGRRDLVPGLLRAGRRLRSLGRADERRGSRASQFVVDGQKVWSSYAHIADWCILLTRSDPGSERHAGLTYLIVDMKAPGRRGASAAPDHGRGGVQRDLLHRRRGAASRTCVGEVGGGWQVAMTTLLHERGTLGFALTAALEVMVGKLIELARDRGATPLQRDAIAREWIELQALRYTAYRSLSALMKTGIPGPEGSILKLQWSEAAQRVTKLALELLGPDAQLLAENAPYGGYWQHQQLRSRGNTIEAGNVRDPAQHHRRARARPAEVALMDFSFTPEQEELRAQARAFLAANPEPSWAGARRARLDRGLRRRGGRRRRARLPRGGGPVRGDGARPHARAVLVDRRGDAAGAAARPAGARSPEARRAGRSRLGPLVADLDTATRVAYVGGDSIWELDGAEREVLQTNDETPAARRRLGRRRPGGGWRAPSSCPQLRARSLTALSLEACGVGARALELAVDYAKERAAVRQADRHLPGDLASARDDADGARARPVARALRRLVHRRGRRARADRRGSGEVALRRCGRRRVRAVDPGARRHRLHLGARPAPALQARALDPGLGGVHGRSFAPRSRPICSTAREVRCRD